MQLSIIIVNFRTFEMTCACIESIIGHLRDIEYEIILVDNAPVETKEADFKKKFSSIIYLQSTANIGFGAANNLGIAKAKGSFLLLINSDTLVSDNSLQKCMGFMQSKNSSSVGLLGCKLVDEKGAYQPSFYPFTNNSLWNYFISNNPILFKLFKIDRYFKEPESTITVGDVSGAFMLLRKEVIETTGTFDTDFFLYCEETEWCRERIAKQYRIVYYPFASIIHYGGKSAPREAMLIQAKLSLALLWFKKGWVPYLGYIIVTILNQLTNAILLPFVGKEAKKSFRKEFSCFVHSLRYLVFTIPKYRKSIGSRPKPLIYKGAEKIFFS